MDKMNNRATLVGKVIEIPHISHISHGERFYRTALSVKRLSGKEDIVPINYSESLDFWKNIVFGAVIEVSGKLCSRNYIGNDGKNHMEVYLLCKEMALKDAYASIKENNSIYLDGTVCKPTGYKEIPKKGIKICQFLLAVNGQFRKSNYIPCICWGSDAVYADKNFDVGTKIRVVKGRIQSREFLKRMSEEEIVTMRVNEVSISAMEVYEESEDIPE